MSARHLHRRRGLAAGLALLTVLGGAGTAAAAPSGRNEIVSLHENGSQARHKSHINGSATVASADGRHIVFSTPAALVRQDRNRVDDVYVRDTLEDTTTLVSVTADRTPGNDVSFEPSISADGRFVAFTTMATNLFPDGNGGALDVVVKDLRTGTVTLASRRSDGSGVRNSFFPVMSGNGRFVAFQTFAALGGKDTDRREDVYVNDRVTGATEQMSVKAGHDIAGDIVVGSISADGRMVTFGTDNSAWVRDRERRRTIRFWHEPDDPSLPYAGGTVGRPVVSGNGRFVAFSTRNRFVVSGDRGHLSDIFRLNLETGRFRKVTLAHTGRNADDESFIPSLSHSGRYVGFMSFADNLVRGDAAGADTFVRDMHTRTTTMASVGVDGPADQDSGRTAVSINADGSTLVYESYANNLVADDANDLPDVFAWKRR
jgi:Tol biopolymer transport system component